MVCYVNVHIKINMVNMECHGSLHNNILSLFTQAPQVFSIVTSIRHVVEPSLISGISTPGPVSRLI